MITIGCDLPLEATFGDYYFHIRFELHDFLHGWRQFYDPFRIRLSLQLFHTALRKGCQIRFGTADQTLHTASINNPFPTPVSLVIKLYEHVGWEQWQLQRSQNPARCLSFLYERGKEHFKLLFSQLLIRKFFLPDLGLDDIPSFH